MNNGFRATIMLLTLLLSYNTKAQNYPIISNNGNAVWISETVVFYVGTDINVGTGSTNDGSFKYIRISAQSWLHNNTNTSWGRNSRLANEANCLPVRFTGLKMHIKKLRYIGDGKRGYTVYLVLGGGTATNYECDITQAVKAGEIECDGCELLRKNNFSAIVANQVSIADELAKLKKLKDNRVLSEAEYQKEKEKLLTK